MPGVGRYILYSDIVILIVKSNISGLKMKSWLQKEKISLYFLIHAFLLLNLHFVYQNIILFVYAITNFALIVLILVARIKVRFN